MCLPATVFTLDESIFRGKRTTLRGYPYLPPQFERNPFPSGTNFVYTKLGTLCYHTVKSSSLYLTGASIGTGS